MERRDFCRAALASSLGGVLLSGAHGAQAQDTGNWRPPELVGKTWFNTPKNAPLPLSSRKGKVTIVHFWTFG